MKILVITHTQYKKNAYSKHLERATSLAGKGHEVTFIITSNKNKFRIEKKLIDNVRVILIPDIMWGVYRQGMGPLNIIRRCFYMLVLNYDIIHGIDSRPVTIIPALLGKFIKKKKLFLEWTDLFGRGGTMVERSSKIYQKTFGIIECFFEEYFRRYADGNIVISHKIKNILLSLKYPEEKILILPLASDMQNLVVKTKDELKKELNLNDEKIYLLYVGSIFPNDAELLICTYRKLIKLNKNLQLILVGKHKWVLDSLKKELNIVVTGFVTDEYLYKYIGATDIHLLPLKITQANLARFPCKVNDYFLGARPLATTAISDLPYFFSKYEFGLISKSDSVEDYTKCVLKVVENNHKWETWGNKAVECAKNEFSLEVISLKLEKFYNYIIKGDFNGKSSSK